MTKSTKYYINSIIGIAIMFLFGFLPPFEPVTPLGMKFLGIFIGLLWLWSFVDMGWPILMAWAAAVIQGCMTLPNIFSSAFANQTALMCIFSMAVIMPIGETGIFDYVAAWILKQKIFKGHPWILSAALILMVYIAGILHCVLLAMFLVFEIAFKIADATEMPHTHPWIGLIVVGAVISFVFGGAFYPFGGLPLFIFGMMQTIAQVQIPFVPYMVFVTICYLMIIAVYILLAFLLRTDVSKLKEVDTSSLMENLPPMSKYQKQVVAFVACFVVLLILAGSAGSLPANPITGILGTLGVVGVSWIFMCIMLIWRMEDKAAFTLSKMGQTIMWDSILIIMIGMSFGPAMAAQETGITAWVAKLFSPILAGQTPFMFTLILAVVTLILTNFLNNTVVFMLMVNIIAVFAPLLNLNVLAIGAIMLFATQTAMVLPGSSYYAALAHGMSGRMGRKNAFYWGFFIVLAEAICLPVMIKLANMIF